VDPAISAEQRDIPGHFDTELGIDAGLRPLERAIGDGYIESWIGRVTPTSRRAIPHGV
jgi:hypothetical protein